MNAAADKDLAAGERDQTKAELEMLSCWNVSDGAFCDVFVDLQEITALL